MNAFLSAKDFAISVGATCVEPSVPVTSPDFEYQNAAHTDIRKRFRLLKSQTVETDLPHEMPTALIRELSKES